MSIIRERSTGLAVALLISVSWLAACATPGLDRKSDWELSTKAQAHYDLAASYLRQGRTPLALREFLEAEKIKPEDPWVQVGLAECYRRKQLFTKSELHLKKALEIRPHFQTAQLNLSALYTNMQRFDEAISVAQILVADPTYPAPWRAYNNLGWAQLSADRIDDARRSLDLALQMNEDFWPAQLNLGILEEKAGNRMEAITRFERVLELDPGPYAEAETNYRIAEIYIALGLRDRALQHLTKSTEQKPSGEWGKKSQKYLKLLR